MLYSSKHLLWIGMPGIVLGCSASAPRDDILATVRDRGKICRVNEEPYRMSDPVAMLCWDYAREKVRQEWAEHRIPMQDTYCFVYTNELASPTMTSGNGSYPVGSIVIKEKLKSADSREAELFTVMRKRAPGYDPDHGDWEYAVVTNGGTEIVERGKLQRCIECHDNYKETDYVTREYLRPHPVPTVHGY
ncbi:MAG: cytochrome P460 family protein [Planctomycetota bacterium]